MASRSSSPNTVRSSTPNSCTYGTHYPNRIFAGYLPGKVTAAELGDFFSSYGTVLEGKIVLDSLGRSRRFGFITFASPEDVKNVLSQTSIVYKGKKINVGPAVKKMGTEEEMTPPQSPNRLEKVPKTSSTPHSMEPSLHERIVTVPPVNENSASNPDAKSTGNVWLKITSDTDSNKREPCAQNPEIHNPMHPITYPAFNVYPFAYPPSFNGPTTYQGMYLHNQLLSNQSLLQVRPCQGEQMYLPPVFNVPRQIVF